MLVIKFYWSDNNYFDYVISYGAWGFNFGTPHTIHEVYRILKPGGIIQIGLPYDANNWKKELVKFVKQLTAAGFTNIKHKYKIYNNIEHRWEITATKPL